MHRPRISCLFLSCQAVALRRLVFLLSLILPFVAFAATKSPIQERADRFLALANSGYQALFRVNSEAQWLAVTDVTPEHDAAAEATAKAYAAFNGNAAIINEARELLTHQKELNERTVRQLTDAAGIMAVQADALDKSYLRLWAEELRVARDLERLLGGEIKPKNT
jgi:hypothetical protein